MTKEEALKNAKVMKAYGEGKEIEFRSKLGESGWITGPLNPGPGFRLGFNFDKMEYRVKVQPRRYWVLARKESLDPFGIYATEASALNYMQHGTQRHNLELLSMVEEIK